MLMSPERLRRLAIEMFGERGWTSRLAAELRVNRTTVFRWLQMKNGVPGPVAVAVESLYQLHKRKHG